MVADHLFVEQGGVPTLVEVKRSEDMRIRREVVGQMLDYAANGVVYWPAERLRSDFEARCASERRDPEATFRASLGDDVNQEQFWGEVEQNLRSGRVRLIFVSDSIPPELRRVIEFLNYRMSPTEVLGIEIKQYVGEGQLKTLVPRVVGQTEQARVQKVQTASVDVGWDFYEGVLQAARLALVRSLFARLQEGIAERHFSWIPRLHSGDIAFQRSGGYNCAGIDLRRGYPHNRQWRWEVLDREALPAVAGAVELTNSYQPASGPMSTPTG